MPTRDLTIDIKSRYDGKGTTAAGQGLKATEEQSKRFEKALRDQEGQAKRSAQQLDAVGSSALKTRRLLENATKRLPKIEVDADTSQPERQLADLTARLRELSGMRIGIDIDPRQVEQQVGDIRRELMTLADAHPEVVVEANVERALTAMEAVEREARKVDGRLAKIDVDVDGVPAALGKLLLIDGALTALEAAGPAKVGAVGVAMLTLPAAAAAAASGIVVGLGGALAGIGLAASYGSEKAQQALAHLREAAKAEATKIGEPFERVWVKIVQVAERDLRQLSPTVRGALEDLAPDVEAFVEHAGESLDELQPAIAGIERAFSAVLQKLGPAMPEVMQHFAAAINEITGAVEENPEVVERMVLGLATLVEWAGRAIGGLTRFLDWLHDNTEALTAFASLINPLAGILSHFGIEAYKASQQAGGLEDAATGAAQQTAALGSAATDAAAKMAEGWSQAYTQFASLAEAIQASKSQSSGQDRLAEAQERLAEVQRTSIEKIKRAQKELGEAQEEAAGRVEQAQRRVADAHEQAAEQVAQAQDRVRDARDALASAVEDAAERETAAEQRVEDARRRTAEVAESSARAIEQAAQRVSDAQVDAAEREMDAERRLQDSHARTAEAVEDLTAARQRAQERLEDLVQSESSAGLDEEGAQLAIERARQRLEELGTDPQATDLDRREADLAYRRSVERLEEVKRRNADLRQQIDEANRAGIEGSAEVVAAKERIAAAQQVEQEAEANLAKARAEGARSVAQAEQALADARRDAARQQQDAERALSEAEAELNKARVDGAKEVLEARRAVADAEKEAAQTAKDAKREIADAEREAAQAVRDAADRIKEAEAEVRQARQDAARDVQKANQDVKDSWVDLSGAVGVTTEQYLAELEKQVRSQEEWAANLISLAGRVPDAMLDELAQLGPGGAEVVAMASQMSDAELRKFISLYSRSGKDAGDSFARNLADAGPALRDIARTHGQQVADRVREGMDGGRVSVFEAARRLGIEIDNGLDLERRRVLYLEVEAYNRLNAPPATSRETGGIDRYAAGGLRATGPMVANRPTVLFGEGRDAEAFIPYDRSFRPRAESLLSQVAGDFGGVFAKPSSGDGAAAGGSVVYVHNAYSITTQVPPGADLAAVGAVNVKAIQEFERRSGASWRRNT